jgi:hypothetical protein
MKPRTGFSPAFLDSLSRRNSNPEGILAAAAEFAKMSHDPGLK